MGNNIYICKFCGFYTFKKRCKECGSECKKTVPLKYSPIDKYKSYRQVYMEIQK